MSLPSLQLFHGFPLYLEKNPNLLPVTCEAPNHSDPAHLSNPILDHFPLAQCAPAPLVFTSSFPTPGIYIYCFFQSLWVWLFPSLGLSSNHFPREASSDNSFQVEIPFLPPYSLSQSLICLLHSIYDNLYLLYQCLCLIDFYLPPLWAGKFHEGRKLVSFLIIFPMPLESYREWYKTLACSTSPPQSPFNISLYYLSFTCIWWTKKNDIKFLIDWEKASDRFGLRCLLFQ